MERCFLAIMRQMRLQMENVGTNGEWEAEKYGWIFCPKSSSEYPLPFKNSDPTTCSASWKTVFDFSGVFQGTLRVNSVCSWWWRTWCCYNLHQGLLIVACCFQGDVMLWYKKKVIETSEWTESLGIGRIRFMRNFLIEVEYTEQAREIQNQLGQQKQRSSKNFLW